MPIARTRQEAGTPSTRSRRRAEEVARASLERLPAANEHAPPAGAAQLEICDRPDGASATQVVALKGEVDVSNKVRVERRIAELLDSGVQEIIVDLSGLWFIDASGLRSLVECRELCRARTVAFALAPLSGTARRVFALTGLDREFTFKSA